MLEPTLVGRVSSALADALPLHELVLVAADRPARVLYQEGTHDPHEDLGLTVLGRDWLHLHQEDAATDAVRAPVLEYGSVLGRAVLDADGVARAVLIAVLTEDQTWTDRSRPLLSLVAATAGPDLLRLIDRPRPTHGGADVTTQLEAQLEAQLASSVDHDELVLLYQPEIDIRTGEILAFEALLRWDHPERGRLGPDLFIGVAERSDVIKMLGSWVIERALRDFASWHDDHITLRINVSPAQLSGDGIVGRLETALREVGVPARQVGIEFTETAASGDVDELAATLRALTDLGVGSAIDDLATGYSTLSRLRILPVDTVKIDRSLVVGLDQDERARAIVRAVMAMAHDLGVEVVGEGIETAAEAEALLEMGCRRGQGHYFGRALEADAAAKLLAGGPVTLRNDASA